MNTVAMNLEALTRADLYRLATTANIKRRSTMTKAQLRAAIEALAEHDAPMYSALELHYTLNFADTATPERIALVHAMAAESQGAYSELCDTFRREGMGNADADTAAWALWVRYLHGEFPREDAPAADAEPVVTATLPAALRPILDDTDALDALTVAPGPRQSLRITGTPDQLADLTHDRLWVAADRNTAEVRERAAYRRWIIELEGAGVRL